MSTFVIDEAVVQVPSWVTSLESFRRWADTDEFPEEGRIGYWHGEVWVDMTKEQIFSHNQVKAELTFVLLGQSKNEVPGRYFPDGARLSNVEADLSCVPDGIFVTRESLLNEKVRLVEGARSRFVELEGSPDIVIEVVSDSSVAKDLEHLHKLYFIAGIREYWLIDARNEPLRFEIWVRGQDGYEPVRADDGWLESSVLGKSFRLICANDELGQPEFSLEAR